jgi:hypothetical protein
MPNNNPLVHTEQGGGLGPESRLNLVFVIIFL